MNFTHSNLKLPSVNYSVMQTLSFHYAVLTNLVSPGMSSCVFRVLTGRRLASCFRNLKGKEEILEVFFFEFSFIFFFTENHRTQTSYDDALIIKLFGFQFVNSYTSLFYIAFFRQVCSLTDCESCSSQTDVSCSRGKRCKRLSSELGF